MYYSSAYIPTTYILFTSDQTTTQKTWHRSGPWQRLQAVTHPQQPLSMASNANARMMTMILDRNQHPARESRFLASHALCAPRILPRTDSQSSLTNKTTTKNTAPMCVSSVLVNISVSKSKLKVTREWPARNAQSRSKSPTFENSRQVGLIGSMLYLIDHNVQND